jgi:hypothetical protein
MSRQRPANWQGATAGNSFVGGRLAASRFLAAPRNDYCGGHRPITMKMSLGAAISRPSNVPLNVLFATGGFALLVGCLALLDARVRDQLAQILTGRVPTGDVGTAVWHGQELATTVFLALRDQSLAYAPLTIFALVALVLVLFMTRT